MSTFSSITSIATSGLYAAQTGISATSDNITNVNTTGYVRKVVGQTSSSDQGQAQGVSASNVSLAVNRFLENTSLAASATVGQAQSLLGDPGASTGFFNQFSSVLSAFSAAANDPSSSLSSSDAVNQVSQFIGQAKSISNSLSGLTSQADTNIGSDVTQVNQLLGQISTLNTAIASASASGGDATDAQNAQNTLISQLSSLVDVKIASTSSGGVSLSTTSGQSLVSQLGAATLAYTPSNSAASQVTIAQPGAGSAPASLKVQSGELQGLLSLRNSTLPNVADQLNEYVTQAANALNQASNASASVPAPNSLTGQAIPTDLTTAVTGFTGSTNIAVVNSGGVVQQQVNINFSTGVITSGGSSVSFTPSTFLTSLNSALGGSATASLNSDNALSITAAGASNGVAIADDSATPSSKNGVGFSQYFGLNNLITTTGVTNYQTGLSTSSANGFSAGTLTLRVTDAAGNEITDVPVSIPSGGTINDVLTSLNSTNGGVGLYGQFNLDNTGELSFTPYKANGASVSVVNDNTSWSPGGASVSQLFGIGDNGRDDRINGLSVNAGIAANPSTIPFAQLNLSAAAGQPALLSGDGSGAQALANAGSTTQSFDSAGGLSATQTSLNQYGSQLAGLLGSQSSAANTAVTNATAVQTEAQSRQQSVEGVNLDQELVNLTTYQQAYSASSRLITATTDMFTALMNM